VNNKSETHVSNGLIKTHLSARWSFVSELSVLLLILLEMLGASKIGNSTIRSWFIRWKQTQQHFSEFRRNGDRM